MSCEFVARDIYRRILGDCENSRGQNIAWEMVRAGHAVAYNSSTWEAERYARKKQAWHLGARVYDTESMA